ncbi:hypothetical protein Agub_g7542, partial [Astrephomene gubernaculifera]
MRGATKRGRRSSTSTVPATPAGPSVADGGTFDDSAGAELPLQQVVQVLVLHLAEHLSQDEFLTARLVCKEWAMGLTAQRRHEEICHLRGPHINPQQGLPARIEALPALLPSLDSLHFFVSERVAPIQLISVTMGIGDDARLNSRIKHLTFTTTSPTGSHYTTWPSDMPFWPIAVTGLKGLQSLTLHGRAPQADLLESLADNCTGLTSLVVGPLLGDPDAPPAGSDSASRLALRPSALRDLSRLTSLRRLALSIAAPEEDEDEDESEEEEEEDGSGGGGGEAKETGAAAAAKERQGEEEKPTDDEEEDVVIVDE